MYPYFYRRDYNCKILMPMTLTPFRKSRFFFIYKLDGNKNGIRFKGFRNGGHLPSLVFRKTPNLMLNNMSITLPESKK